MVALSGPASAQCQTDRESVERQYRILESALFRNNVPEILAVQAPTFTSISPNGDVYDYQAMEERTRLMASLIDSVIYVRNTIRDFASRGDTAVADVCQEFSRIQRIDGQPRRVDTSALQRERWVRIGAEWKREHVDDVHGTRWFVDGVRVSSLRPNATGATPTPQDPDGPTGCGRL
jgi:hypothetical protein